MDYKYLDSSIDLGNLKLHDSDCINEFLLKNNNTETSSSEATTATTKTTER